MEMITTETTRGCMPSRSDTKMEMPVTVRLFGILALLARQRLVELTLFRGCTAGDVLSELGERFGADFLARLLRVPGELRTYCALFVNGTQVDDLNAKIAADCARAEVGVILFMASEGG